MSKWEMVRLGDVVTIKSGGTPKKDIEDYYVNGDIPWVKTGDLKSKFIFHTEDNITESGVKNSSAKWFPIDTLLVAMYGATIGACSILKIEATTNQACAAILPNDSFNNTFLYYYFTHTKSNLISMGVGGAQPNISGGIIKNLQIPLPPLEVQRQIADVLDRANVLIEMRKAQIDRLDLLVKSQFIEMFGDPVTNPKEAPTQLLGELAILKSGKNVVAKDIHDLSAEYQYPCYGGNGVRGYVNTYTHEGNYPLIGRQGALCGNIQLATGRFYPTEHAVVVSPIEDYSIIWMFYCLAYLNLNRLQTGAAQPGLNIDILNKVEIPFPPSSLQTQFTNFVEKVAAQKALLNQSLTKLVLNYKSLIQKCFRGEVF